MNNGGKVPPASSEFKNKPDGWETMAKASDGNVWEMSQREEDILLQEFERRIAYSKFQVFFPFLIIVYFFGCSIILWPHGVSTFFISYILPLFY